MDFIDKLIAPPKSWEKFEDLTRSLFAAIWKSPLAQKNGRSGQAQNGVDVFGTPADAPSQTFGVQCKGKNKGYGAKCTIAEFEKELGKAEEFTPKLGHWTFATTAPNDGPLQEHARTVSEQRVSEGRFPVEVIGWDTIQALLSSHQQVIEEFYPEHAGDLSSMVRALRALPGAAELDKIRLSLLAFSPQAASSTQAVSWKEVEFGAVRDLGPALMGRSLGPSDVDACPTLPEVPVLIGDMERANSARLAGVPGAGKSISILQSARKMHDRGWRVLRSTNSTGLLPSFDSNQEPTLYIVDDAHLSHPASLRDLEERATSSRWVLSAYTVTDDKGGFPGAIYLDAKRAVQVIADGLRKSPDTTLAAVRRADDRVGDRPGQESLEHRLNQAAEKALYPWQFCFILGGGWRRSAAMASSARAVGADLVLAAAAVRQIATRDAPCSRDAMMKLIRDGLTVADTDAAISWLLSQRLLLSNDDLRCPHQRLASVLFDSILQGQSAEGRRTIAGIIQTVLTDGNMPLAGLAALLSELSTAGEFRQWRLLVQPEWLVPVLARCWQATESLEIRNACWVLSSLHGFLPEEMAEVAAHMETLVTWIQDAPEGASYAIGGVINHVYNTDKTLHRRIITQVDPSALARRISTVAPVHACEVASLLSLMHAGADRDWTTRYLDHIDRTACQRIVLNWPSDAHLSLAANFCAHFCYVDPEFGYTLIETLIPAIADRLRADPQDAFGELDEIVWHALRLYDPLHIYIGKLAPSQRMRQVGRKISACWSPVELAIRLSHSTHRTFQAAAGLLSFLHNVSPTMFDATVRELDWNEIDRAIGEDWATNIGDARMLLGVAYAVPAVRPNIQEMIRRNEKRIVEMSTHLAFLAPASARRHVAAEKRIALCRWGHVDWELGAHVLAEMAQSESALVPVFLKPHHHGLAAALSMPSPTFFDDSLLFLQVVAQIEMNGLEQILDQINVETAKLGWTDALRGDKKHREPGARGRAQQAVALLIHHSLHRPDSLGELARQLRHDFPKRSVPLDKTLATVVLVKPTD